MGLIEQDRGLTPPTHTVTLLGWLAALAGAIWVLTALGRGALAVPSILEAADWRAWIAASDAATIFFAVLRVATLAIAWYLFGTLAVGIVAHLVRSARLLAVANLVALPPVRRMLQATFGAGLAAASLTAGSSPVTPAPPAVAATVEPATLAPAMQEPVTLAPAAQEQRVQPVPSIPPLRDRADVRPPAVVEHAPARTTWTVRPGDHLWSISHRTLAQAWEREPSDDETTQYWQRLIARNRSVLTDPGNPDLILPGQVFDLPAIPRS